MSRYGNSRPKAVVDYAYDTSLSDVNDDLTSRAIRLPDLRHRRTLMDQAQPQR